MDLPLEGQRLVPGPEGQRLVPGPEEHPLEPGRELAGGSEADFQLGPGPPMVEL